MATVSDSPERGTPKHTAQTAALWALLAIYAAARVLQLIPDRVPMPMIVALHVLPPALFALIHGSILWRVRGALVFIVLCLVVGNVFENAGVLTGFPFGHYHFTEAMGPKVFNVPVLLGIAYLGLGYLSWTLARLLLGEFRPFAVPVLAGFIMVAWDLSMDPVWSTVVHAWIWHNGGPYFGVPVSNFFGWYLTVFLWYQLFALYLRRQPVAKPVIPSGYWDQAVLFYAIAAAGNLLVLARAGPSLVSDGSGVQWRVTDIAGASAVVSVFVMGAFVVLGALRTRRTAAGNR